MFIIKLHAQFTTVPCLPLSDKQWGRYVGFSFEKRFVLSLFVTFLTDKGLKCTVVNRALLPLQGGSIAIALTVPIISRSQSL